MSYVRSLTICLLLVYFVSAAGCHCFDLVEKACELDGSTKITVVKYFLQHYMLITHIPGVSKLYKANQA